MKSKMQTVFGKYWLQNGREVSFAFDVSNERNLIKFFKELGVVNHTIYKKVEKKYYEPVEKRG
jgi:hypothetical protein